MGIYYKYLDTSKQATFYLRFFMPAPLSCSSFLKICFFRLDIWLILAENNSYLLYKTVRFSPITKAVVKVWATGCSEYFK